MVNYIPIITRGYSRKVSLDEILYLEQRQRRLAVVTIDQTYLCYERIENMERILDERFYHTLKKLVVNLDKIIVVENQSITFVDGTVMNLGRESYIRTKQVFSAYFLLITSVKIPPNNKVIIDSPNPSIFIASLDTK